MRLIRQILFVVSVVTIFAGLAGLVYLTHHPEAPILERAEAWPAVGPLAERFRRAYLSEPQEPDDPDEGKIEYVLVDRDGKEITGPINLTGGPIHPDFERQQHPPPPRRAAPPPPRRIAPPPPRRIAPPPPRRVSPGVAGEARARAATVAVRRERPVPIAPPSPPPPPTVPSWQARDWRWFLPESPVRRHARSDSQASTRLRSLSYLPVLAENGTWDEVVYAGERGFIDTAWRPPYKRRKARRGILRHQAEPVRTSDLGTLREARKIFGIKRPARALGPYQLFTDVEDEDLLAFLDQAASLAEEAYFARFGRLPSGDPLRTAVLFAREADYRAFGSSAKVPLTSHTGHAGIGVLAFFAEGRTKESLATTLVHEIGHLLNDRALAYTLPPWLEEGLAQEVGALWLENDAPVAEAGARGSRQISLDAYSARILSLAKILGQGRLPSVDSLLRLDRDRFYSDGINGVSYSMSAAFIRFLLDGEEGRFAEGFRHFLERIAVGTGADLMKQLAADPADLDRGLRAFIESEIVAIEKRFSGVRFR